jgi:hypothetical protein
MVCAGAAAGRVENGNKSMGNQLLAIDDSGAHLSIVRKIATQVADDIQKHSVATSGGC